MQSDFGDDVRNEGTARWVNGIYLQLLREGLLPWPWLYTRVKSTKNCGYDGGDMYGL